MTVFITGANGLLGQHLIKLLVEQTDFNIVASGKGAPRFITRSSRLVYKPLDITDGMAVSTLIGSVKPDVLIHTAALTQADDCEQNQVSCWNINVTATRFLADAARQAGSFFIFLSTDFVFDGLSGPYEETDQTGPVNYYGSSKLAAEKSVMQTVPNYAIVRTCLVYGNYLSGNRSNIIGWVKSNLEQDQVIKVVNDQWRTPTYVQDLAMAILLIIRQKATGIFHISGDEFYTPYEIALKTADCLNLGINLIEKANAALFSQPAARPAKTGFKIIKARNILGFKPLQFEEGLKRTLT